jgi:hypothetical protein
VQVQAQRDETFIQQAGWALHALLITLDHQMAIVADCSGVECPIRLLTFALFPPYLLL